MQCIWLPHLWQKFGSESILLSKSYYKFARKEAWMMGMCGLTEIGKLRNDCTKLVIYISDANLRVNAWCTCEEAWWKYWGVFEIYIEGFRESGKTEERALGWVKRGHTSWTQSKPNTYYLQLYSCHWTNHLQQNIIFFGNSN